MAQVNGFHQSPGGADGASTFQDFFENFDWAQTDFGPRDAWPPELSQMVRFMIADTSPCIMYWGESHLIIYNEAAVPILGDRHPNTMGKPAREGFARFWEVFGKTLDLQRQNGRTLQGESLMVLIERQGFLEETYFDWKLIPILGADGKVKGSYGMPTDLTHAIIHQRQIDCTRNLTDLTIQANDLRELWRNTLAGLTSESKDIGSAMIYTLDPIVPADCSVLEATIRCSLETSAGLGAEPVLAKPVLNLTAGTDGFASTMLDAIETDSIFVVEAADMPPDGFLTPNAKVADEVPSRQFVVIPLVSEGMAFAFLIVAISPYRRYGPLYQEFFELVKNILEAQISRVRLSEEVERQDQLVKEATLDFQRSETKFLKFAERSVAGLAILDTDYNLLFANEAWNTFFGTSRDDTNSLAWVDSVYQEDVPLLHNWHEEVLKAKQGGTLQLRSKLPFSQDSMHSEHRTAMCAIYPDLNESGEVESVMLLIMDISEVKWIEEQLLEYTKRLEESEDSFRNYAEHCPLGICRTDRDGYLIYANSAWHTHYNFIPGRVPNVSQPWLPFVHEDDVQQKKDFFQRLQTHSGPETCEFRLKDEKFTIREGGRTYTNDVYVLATGFSNLREDGTLAYIDFWVTNISAQKMAAKILSDKMEEAIRLKNQQERFIDMISHEIRNPLSAVLQCAEEVLHAMKTGLATIEGLTVESAKQDEQDEPSPESPASINQALTKELDSALDAANTIIYCVQHQKQIVDDVLTLSKLDSDLLIVSPSRVELMTLVTSSLKIFELELKASNIALSIVQDESLKKLSADWVMLDPKRFLQIIINLVTNAIKFTKKSREKRITIKASAHEERPASGKLGGVEYVPQLYRPKEPTTTSFDTETDINCNLADNTRSDVFLSFSVTDTGLGLTESQRALLFNRFAQASPKTHIEYGGSGLGLFISRQITEMLDGQIGVTSTPGVGSTFAFYIRAQRIRRPPPSTPATDPTIRLSSSLGLVAEEKYRQPTVNIRTGKGAVKVAEREVSPDSPPSPTSVLVVEDNIVNQRVLCKQLRHRGFLVQSANHGKEALEAMFAERIPTDRNPSAGFDVVLCDIEMPIMNGIEFTKEVRRLESVGELEGHVPILGVTANVRSTQVSGALEAGMDGVTTKPYRIQELIEHINRVHPVN
ncbi:hypothetical protein F5Y17DRAFT_468155 [Xylariaceae sp. FL0594]|nr:hypothetical protein F5Y17DRAFT_468155 [Xylariaceae sp. FL0594]